jgi:hypothetical protein
MLYTNIKKQKNEHQMKNFMLVVCLALSFANVGNAQSTKMEVDGFTYTGSFAGAYEPKIKMSTENVGFLPYSILQAYLVPSSPGTTVAPGKLLINPYGGSIGFGCTIADDATNTFHFGPNPDGVSGNDLYVGNIHGGICMNMVLETTGSTGIFYHRMFTSNAAPMLFQYGTAGRVGIGNVIPWTKLSVEGGISTPGWQHESPTPLPIVATNNGIAVLGTVEMFATMLSQFYSMKADSIIASQYTPSSKNSPTSNGFLLFPNPFLDQVTVMAPANSHIQIYTESGILIKQFVCVGETIKISVPDLKAGIYTFLIEETPIKGIKL